MGNLLADGAAAIEEGAASGRDLGEYAAGDDIARRKLGRWVKALHEALARAVDQDRAFAAQRFRRERRGIGADIDRGRVKLHELGVGDGGARAGGECHGLAARVGRIGRHGVEAADAAGREHDGAGGKEIEGAVAARLGADEADARHAAVRDDEVLGVVVLEEADRRRGAHGGDERLHDRGAGAVAGNAHDALRRVRGLAREHEVPLEIAIEGDAVGEEIADALGGLLGDGAGDGFVDDAGAGHDGVVGMRLGRVALADGGCDAALRPGARRAFSERRCSNDRHRERRELQCREKSREAGADDDDVAGPERRSAGRGSSRSCRSWQQRPWRGNSLCGSGACAAPPGLSWSGSPCARPRGAPCRRRRDRRSPRGACRRGSRESSRG